MTDEISCSFATLIYQAKYEGIMLRSMLYQFLFLYSSTSVQFFKFVVVVVVVFLPFLGPLPWHIEVPRLGVESEHSCRPVPQPQQYRILNPLSEARDPWILIGFITAEL